MLRIHDIFGVDPDPDLDPRIHASDQWIRILIRIRIEDDRIGREENAAGHHSSSRCDVSHLQLKHEENFSLQSKN